MYDLLIHQTRSYMSEMPEFRRYQLLDITHAKIYPNCFEQIGFRTNCARCVILSIYPTGLNFPLFATNEEDASYIVDKINNFVKDDKRKGLQESLYLPSDVGGGHQTIRIIKI